MTERFEVVFPLLGGSEKRYAYIYLPKSYFKEPNRRYPVLYMFDGHNVFFDEDATYGKSWGMEKFMNRHHIQMIICAVECNHHPDNGRLKEYSPFTFRHSQVGLIEGRGKMTMDWYVNELKPAVDAHFRTLADREHTFIAGSSMGGLMSLYALMDYNHVFSRAAALSPSLWTDPRKVKSMINKAALNPNTILYMGQGIYHLGATEGWGFDTWQNPEEINNQLKFNCNFDNIEGTIFFTYKDLVPGKNEIKNQGLQKLKEIWNNK